MRRLRADEENPRNFQSAGGQAVISYQSKKPTGEPELTFLDAGQNPPPGVAVFYYLKDKPEGQVTLTFRDAQGQEIKTFSSKKPEQAPVGEAVETGELTAGQQEETGKQEDEEKKEPRVPAEAGLNRFVWNLRYPDARNVKGAVLWAGSVDGPQAPPGTYSVELTLDGQTQSASFDLLPDPRAAATQADLDAQFAFLIELRDRLSEAHDAVNQIRAVRQQVGDWQSRVKDRPDGEKITEAAKALKEQLTSVEEELIQVRSKAMEDPLNYPIKLNNKLAALASVVAAGDAAPTRQSREVFADLSARLDQQLARLREILDTRVAEFNTLVRESDLPAIVPPSRVEG
jgi:hypothetical protein